MIDNHVAYIYETSYRGPFLITQCCTNGTITLQCGAKIIGCNIHPVKSHTSDTSVEDVYS